MRLAAKRLAVVGAVLCQQGCAAVVPSAGRGPQLLPKSLGESASAYGYVPVDALAVHTYGDGPTCKAASAGKAPVPLPLVEAFPDISVRFAVGSFSTEGGVNFGPAKVTAEGSTYRAVLDYINVDVVPVDFLLRKVVSGTDSSGGLAVRGARLTDIVSGQYGYEAVIIHSSDSAKRSTLVASQAFLPVTVPVYVGIGMRLTADIRALKSGIGLTSLGGIAAEAQAGALAGTLTVQTLGITGKAIATALPLPSKLDQTTIENAILAIGSSRAALYGSSEGSTDLTRTPRVVGLYSPVGSDPALINAIYSELSRSGVAWDRPCRAQSTSP